LGGAPQDLKYKGEKTVVEIGDGTTIREYTTIHTGTELGGGRTIVGSRCLLMAYTHIAHDCILGDCIVVANGVQMAGHIVIEDGARISGLAAIHHFVRIGACSFVAGMARLTIDVPPFTMAAGYPARIRGLNYEGLKRRGLSEEAKNGLRKAFRLCYREKMPRKDAFLEIEKLGCLQHPEVKHFVDFLRMVENGRHGRALEGKRAEVPPEERDGDLAFRYDGGEVVPHCAASQKSEQTDMEADGD
jgi:UDP-N-acetylglucosamine acyltransferase